MTQCKQCSADFLTKKLVVNINENPDTPVITIENHHQGIVSKETFLKAQQLIYEHGKYSREGKRFSSSCWFSNKIYCGRCDTIYSKSGSKSKTPVFLKCSNRAHYGTEKRIGFKGRPVGCDNGFLSEKLL